MTSRRFSRRRPRRSRRGSSTRSLAIRALQSTDQERKFLDNTFQAVAVNDTLTGASIFPLNLIPQGASNASRIGLKALMKSLYLQLVVEKQAADISLNGYVRVLVVVDRQYNGANPTWGNILDLPGTGDPVVEQMSANNLANSNRFQTIFDRRIRFQKDFMEGHILKKYLPLNLTTQWSGAGVTFADLRTNAVLLCLTGHITTGGNVPDFSGSARLRFTG